MSPFNVCEWYGIDCNPANEILEIDLSRNGLTGKLQDVWALLPHTSSVMLRENAITGPIPGKAFGAMPLLTYLHLQDNELTGTIPVSLKDTGVLGTCNTMVLLSLVSRLTPRFLTIVLSFLYRHALCAKQSVDGELARRVLPGMSPVRSPLSGIWLEL